MLVYDHSDRKAVCLSTTDLDRSFVMLMNETLRTLFVLPAERSGGSAAAREDITLEICTKVLSPKLDPLLTIAFWVDTLLDDDRSLRRGELWGQRLKDLFLRGRGTSPKYTIDYIEGEFAHSIVEKFKL